MGQEPEQPLSSPEHSGSGEFWAKEGRRPHSLGLSYQYFGSSRLSIRKLCLLRSGTVPLWGLTIR